MKRDDSMNQRDRYEVSIRPHLHTLMNTDHHHVENDEEQSHEWGHEWNDLNSNEESWLLELDSMHTDPHHMDTEGMSTTLRCDLHHNVEEHLEKDWYRRRKMKEGIECRQQPTPMPTESGSFCREYERRGVQESEWESWVSWNHEVVEEGRIFEAHPIWCEQKLRVSQHEGLT